MISSQNVISAYLKATEATPPLSTSDAVVTQAGRDFERVMAQADRSAVGAMNGTGDTRSLVMSLTEAELALDAAVAIRDKVVEAYQEILRMPV